MSRSCGSSALLVGSEHRLPVDPCEYNVEGSVGPGCNSLRCEACGAQVRAGPPGSRLKDGSRPGFVAAMYENKDWASLPFVDVAPSRWRLYACKCRWWEEPSEHLLVNDHDSPGDPDLPWVCSGHPSPELPLKLGDLTISANSDWPSILKRILGGASPRKLDRKDEGPAVWLAWLYAYLHGLPVAPKLARAVGERIGDRDERVVGTVLLFFRRFPAADGIDLVVARAETDLGGVLATHHVPEHEYRPSSWDLMIAAMKQRTHENDAIDLRVVDVVRKVMLLPAGAKDPVKETLTHHWNADAFRDDDLAWMAENIVALETAGPGRWTKVMNFVVSAARKKPGELDHLILIAGGAIIQSGRVPAAEVRDWIQKRGYRHEAWVLVLESMLEKTP